jgi:beta-glucosidase
MRPPQEWATVELAAGQSVAVSLTHVVKDHTASEDLLVALQLAVDCTVEDDDASLAHAVADATAADLAVVVVGTSEEVESEGFDRTSLALPGRQDELVHRVAAARPETVVVVNAGAPVLMPWRDEVAATLLAWFPGQEFGGALADVLLGRREPGGRLPTTWPAAEDATLPSTTPVDGRLDYSEGLHVGYRRFLRDGDEPAYWFGHGLGYTTWSYDDLAVAPEEVAVTVTNTGARAGRELVQVYLARPESRLERPVRWLAAHTWVEAEPGASVTARLAVPPRAFEHWADGGWAREPGTFTVEVGRSAGEIVLRAELG